MSVKFRVASDQGAVTEPTDTFMEVVDVESGEVRDEIFVRFNYDPEGPSFWQAYSSDPDCTLMAEHRVYGALFRNLETEWYGDPECKVCEDSGRVQDPMSLYTPFAHLTTYCGCKRGAEAQEEDQKEAEHFYAEARGDEDYEDEPGDYIGASAVIF